VTGMDKAMAFALLWFGVAVAMIGSILGTELLGWPVENTLWWAALVGMLALGAAQVADYLRADPDA